MPHRKLKSGEIAEELKISPFCANICQWESCVQNWCGPGSDGNKGVLRIPQSSSITGASPSDCLISYPGYSLGGGVLPVFKEAVGIFYSSSSWLGQAGGTIVGCEMQTASSRFWTREAKLTSSDNHRNASGASTHWDTGKNLKRILKIFAFHVELILLGNGWREDLTATTQECYEQYWTSPGGSTPQSSGCMVTYYPSWKLSKLDQPDMQSTAGEIGTSSLVKYSCGPLHMAEQRQGDHLEPTYSSYV